MFTSPTSTSTGTSMKTFSFETGTVISSIGSAAFSGSGITTIEIPDTVSSLASSVYSNCLSGK